MLVAACDWSGDGVADAAVADHFGKGYKKKREEEKKKKDKNAKYLMFDDFGQEIRCRFSSICMPTHLVPCLCAKR